MSSWFHNIKGKYQIGEKNIGLDYGKLFLNPIEAKATLVHELVHGIIAMQDFGQATHTFIKTGPEMEHLKKHDVDEMIKLMMNAQIDVQEGYATFMQVNYIGREIGKKKALEYAHKNLSPDYLIWFKNLEVGWDYTGKRLDIFTGRISQIAMETAIRTEAQKLNLFENPKKLEEYLSNPDKNPNIRLKKILTMLSSTKYHITKQPEKICELSGIKYYPYSTKQDVADFMNYCNRLTPRKTIVKSEQIGDTPTGLDAFKPLIENTFIGNMNIRFAGNSEAIFNINDLIYYADVAEIIFVSQYKDREDIKTSEELKRILGSDPEVLLGLMRKTGEKYVSALSEENAAKILSNEFKQATLIVKEGGYDLINHKSKISNCRPPNIVIYHKVKNLLNDLKQFTQKDTSTLIKIFSINASKDHPFFTLFVNIDVEGPIYGVNVIGEKEIANLMKELGGRTVRMDNDFIRLRKKDINNFMTFWSNTGWDIDWAETIINQDKIYFR